MLHATTTYEKLLEAQNEQLRETVEKLIMECEVSNRNYSVAQTQYNNLYKEIIQLLTHSKIHVETIKSRRQKETNYTVWTTTWYPDSEYAAEQMPMLNPIMRKMWLDFLERNVQGMKRSYMNNKTGKYNMFSEPGVHFPTTKEATP